MGPAHVCESMGVCVCACVCMRVRVCVCEALCHTIHPFTNLDDKKVTCLPSRTAGIRNHMTFRSRLLRYMWQNQYRFNKLPLGTYTVSILISAHLPLLAVRGWKAVLGGGGQCDQRAGAG